MIVKRERTVGMQEVKFTLRTLTPLFLAGADQTKAELRAPTFRGLMRYWQRALVGGLVGTTSRGLEKVMEAETAIFGATDTGSAVSVKVSEASNAPREFTEQISVRVGGRWQATGKGYLLWSMAKSGREDRGNLKPARWFFPPGTQFPPIIFNKRRASPLLLRVVELQGNRYVGIAVLFKTAGNDVFMQDYKLIEDWANEFRGKQEVML